MIRNLKALGLALVAVFALSAVAASTASAVDKFTAAEAAVEIEGISHNTVLEFTGAGIAWQCTTSIFDGTITNGATQTTVLPTYVGRIGATPHTVDCDSGLGEIEVRMNGCGYILTGETTGSDGGTDATVWVECPAGQEIEIEDTDGLCTLEIPAQTPTSGGVKYTNQGAGATKDILVTTTITGITYTTEGFFCALAGLPSEGNDADYTGTVTVKGYQHGTANQKAIEFS